MSKETLKQGNVQDYETVYILKPDLTDEMIKKVSDRLQEIITKNEGQFEVIRDLGRKALAYRIAKYFKGHYFMLHFHGTGKTVSELEKNLRIMEDVIRFLTVQGIQPLVDATQPEKTEEVAA